MASFQIALGGGYFEVVHAMALRPRRCRNKTLRSQSGENPMYYWWKYVGETKNVGEIWKEPVHGSGKRVQRHSCLPMPTVGQEQKTIPLHHSTIVPIKLFVQADKSLTNAWYPSCAQVSAIKFGSQYSISTRRPIDK